MVGITKPHKPINDSPMLSTRVIPFFFFLFSVVLRGSVRVAEKTNVWRELAPSAPFTRAIILLSS